MSKTSYTVEVIDQVVLVWSDTGVPMTAMSLILKAAHKNAVMDIGLANRMGAAMAVGLPGDLQAYRKTNPAAGAIVQNQIRLARACFSGTALDEIIAYLDGYDRGQSADALLSVTTGINTASDSNAHPHDLGDLGRCVRLYRASQIVRENFAKAGALSHTWRGLVENWDQKLASVKTQNPESFNAPGQAE